MNDVSATPPSPADPAADPAREGQSVDVAVNLLWCVPGEVGGSEQYLVRSLVGLASQRGAFAPTLFCLRAFAEAHPELVDLYPMTVAGISGTSRPWRIVVENTWLRRRSRTSQLVHHGGGTAPFGGGSAMVLTIHDLQYLTHPQYLTASKLRYLSWTVPRSVRRATIVAVPTEYVRGTVIGAYGVPAERVIVVPHGVESTLGADAPSSDDLRREYALGAGRVLVFPAITHPHKGHVFLLEVMARHWPDADLRLVLLGGPGSADAEVTAAIERLGLRGRVVRAGRVPDAHRDGLIALADALVFPSEYEGFGAPVVEAMALGTPVICSDQPALAEVVGDAGIVLPRDCDAWASALDLLAARNSELRTAGLSRAQHFTAQRSGAGLLSAYRAALGNDR